MAPTLPLANDISLGTIMVLAWVRSIGCVALLSLVAASSEAAAQSLSLKKNQIYRVSGGSLCGFIAAKNRWRPVQKAGKAYKLVRRPTEAASAACASLLKPSSRRSLSQLPGADEILSAVESSDASVNAVSGTPPSFPELVAGGGTNVFWRTGVVDAIATGSPTQEQCGEFFSSSVDGQSGGYGACYLAEGTGYSISEIAASGTTLCYMRKFPPAAAQDSRIVRVVSGSLPAGGVRNIFAQPDGPNARVIQISTVGEEENGATMFIRVYSAAQNAAQGNQYRVDFWACDNGTNGSPQEAQQFRLNAGGELIANSVHLSEGQRFTSTVRGFLRAGSDNLEFDLERGRSAFFGGGNNNPGTERNFKSRVEINGSNEIRHWVRDAFGSSSVRTGYSAARFAGDGLVTLRFLEGAFKDAHSGNQSFEFSGATEFRDTYYASAPTSQFTADVAAVNFGGDEFFQEGVELPSISSSQFSCRTSADLAITLDMSREAMQQVAASCEAGRIDGEVQFCRSNLLRTASERYSTVCTGQ